MQNHLTIDEGMAAALLRVWSRRAATCTQILRYGGTGSERIAPRARDSASFLPWRTHDSAPRPIKRKAAQLVDDLVAEVRGSRAKCVSLSPVLRSSGGELEWAFCIVGRDYCIGDPGLVLEVRGRTKAECKGIRDQLALALMPVSGRPN